LLMHSCICVAILDCLSFFTLWRDVCCINHMSAGSGELHCTCCWWQRWAQKKYLHKMLVRLQAGSCLRRVDGVERVGCCCGYSIGG
jgi:hypothetical protein